MEYLTKQELESQMLQVALKQGPVLTVSSTLWSCLQAALSEPQAWHSQCKGLMTPNANNGKHVPGQEQKTGHFVIFPIFL